MAPSGDIISVLYPGGQIMVSVGRSGKHKDKAIEGEMGVGGAGWYGISYTMHL